MDILSLIQNGESETLEFKTSFGKEVIITLSAFANTKGGKVLFGVGNDGKATESPNGRNASIIPLTQSGKSSSI